VVDGDDEEEEEYEQQGFFDEYDEDDVDDEDDDEDEDDGEVNFSQQKYRSSDLQIVNEDGLSIDVGEPQSPRRVSQKTILEYGSLRPGTVVQVQVGDVQLARKAWKKRRRSGSPLLVPCSVLNVDRQSMVRWNLIFLLEKFGRGKTRNKGANIEISLVSLAKTYRSYLKSSLQRQVDALGFESSQEMLKTIFNKKIQESYGVVLEERVDKEDGKTMLYLSAPISRVKAQKRTANAPIVQFRLYEEGDFGNEDTLTHTGWTRALKENNDENGGQREYAHYPLSAALRVSQKDEMDTGRVVEGNIHSAVVFDFDKKGDGGAPLLTLSLNPGAARQRLKLNADRKHRIISNPKVLVDELSVGDGPYNARVVDVKGNMAYVDIGAARHVSGTGSKALVLGLLYFKDAKVPVLEGNERGAKNNKTKLPWVEFDDEDEEETERLITASLDELDMLDVDDDDEDDEDEAWDDIDDLADNLLSLRKETYSEDGEVEEDISHLFEVDQNGNLMYKDPESGELKILEEGDEVGDEIEDEEDDLEFVEEEEKLDGGVLNHDDGEGEIEASLDDEVNELDNFDGLYEDVSDDEMASLFTENDDGTITYSDPETGETMIVDKDDDEYQDMMVVKSLIDSYLPKKKVVAKAKAGSTANIEAKKDAQKDISTKPMEKSRLQPKFISVGDYVKVYVQHVSKSGNFRVTTNPLIKGKKLREVKNEEEASKKLNRLRKRFGGSLEPINTRFGKKCAGVVKATSKTGEWVYVQPKCSLDLPVGVGSLAGEGLESLTAGDYVRIKIAGIDYDRGQLSLQVLEKLDQDTFEKLEAAEENKKPTKTINVNKRNLQKHGKGYKKNQGKKKAFAPRKSQS